MFDTINNEFDATLEKTEVLTESMANLYDIDRYYMVESFSDDITDEEVEEFTESLDAFNSKVKKVFKQMIEAVKKFTKDLIETIKKKINDAEFKLKMKQLKKALDLNKDFVYKAENPNDYTFKTYAEAITFYDKIVNDADTMLKVLTTKKFEEREDWDEYATKLLDAYNEKITKILGATDIKFQMPNNKSSDALLKYANDKIKESTETLKKLDSIVEKHIKNAEAASIKDTEPTHVSVYQKISSIVVKTGKKIKTTIAKYPFTTISVLLTATSAAVIGPRPRDIKNAYDAVGAAVGGGVATASIASSLYADKLKQRKKRKEQEAAEAKRKAEEAEAKRKAEEEERKSVNGKFDNSMNHIRNLMTNESVDAFDIFDNMTLDEFTESLNNGDDLDSLLESATNFDSLINDFEIDNSYYESSEDLDFSDLLDDLNF